MVKHPAKYNERFIPIFAEIIKAHLEYNSDTWLKVFDPMAGVGTIHQLRDYGIETYGLEIEKEWADQHPCTWHGDVLQIAPFVPFPPLFFDAIVVSPPYGNRLADNRKIQENDWVRHTYNIYLGHDLNPNNSGKMHWGRNYRDFHTKAWKNCDKLLKNGGIFVLNCKNHIRQKDLKQVTEWHVDTLVDMNYEILEHWQVELNGHRHGANWEARDWYESIVVLRKL